MSKVNTSMLDLYAIEVETHTTKILDILLELEGSSQNSTAMESLMRSAHSIKGAARLVNVDIAVKLAHALEDCFVAAQEGKIQITTDNADIFIQSVDFLKATGKMSAEHIETPSSDTLATLSSLNERLRSVFQNPVDPVTSARPAAAKTDNSDNAEYKAEIRFAPTGKIDAVMLDLFRTELDNNIRSLSDGLLALSENSSDIKLLENMMRASHSIKGAARLVGVDFVVKLAHAMEDCFVAAQNSKIVLVDDSIDCLLKCVDLLKSISELSSAEHGGWLKTNAETIRSLIHDLNSILKGNTAPLSHSKSSLTESIDKPGTIKPESPAKKQTDATHHDAVVRVSATRINTLLGLSGELTVSSNWIRGYSTEMRSLKKKHNELIDSIDRLRTILSNRNLTELELNLLGSMHNRAESYRDSLTSRLLDLDEFDRRSTSLTSRMNHEIIASRMRPFKDATQGYRRMVRDISRSLNKKINLIIRGEDTQVDREILEKIEAPINHMIRNAIDHGIEKPEDRLAAGKPEQGTIILEAKHSAGQLSISVADDGRGVDIEILRKKVLDRNLVNKTMASSLSKSELLDFLFLPSFSTREEVTELSGRGVGLDVVHSTLQELRGKLHANTELGQGMRINMELPLTLSVIRCLLVMICNELYAFPLAAIHTLLHINKDDISVLEDKQYITLNNNHVGLIHCAQILGMNSDVTETELPVVVVGDWNNLYGLVVDKLMGERNLAMRPLHKSLGKVKDVNAAALTDNGEPILILDVDDLIQSIRTIISGKDIVKVGKGRGVTVKRILVVDDSLTVREVEKKLLESRGYAVDIAIDGVDAWNTVRTGSYDLVISDVDMPRMNGIELVKLLKNDAALRSLPVMMVSYKDRAEDKQKGLEAGADYYLTKGSFHDETLLDAVRDLIGEATQ